MMTVLFLFFVLPSATAGGDCPRNVAPEICAAAAQFLAGASPANSRRIHIDEIGMIQVYLHVTKASSKLQKNLSRLGFRTDLFNAKQRIFQGWAPSREIQKIATLRDVVRITLPRYAVLR
ncbi:MAG: hypothetical protein V1495_05955 [Pseudomonadota bacterium]